MKKYNTLLGLFIFLFLLLPIKVYATDATITISGANQVEKGKSITLNVMVTGISGSPLTNFQGTIGVVDSSCVTINVTPQNGATHGNNIIVYSQSNGVSSNISFAQVVVTASNNVCSTNITISDGRLQFEDRVKYSGRTASKTINVVEPAPSSGNNNNPGNNPGENTNSGGNNSGNSGGNTKPSGNTGGNSGGNANSGSNSNSGGNTSNNDKRSNNANLKSLSVSNGTLSPGFSAGITSYTMQVDLDVDKLDIKAETSDENAKLSINNPNLAENARTVITIKVTAENGSTKTYTISVVRGELPEDPLSDNNKLESLVPSVGILSPKFDPDKLNYYVYLPYEIEDIDFEYDLSSKLAQVDLEGDKELKANSKNIFKIVVKAEDGSERIYTITVFRAINPEFIENDSVKIKSLKLGSAKIIGEFDSDKTHYYYTGKLDLSDIIPVDSNATYEIVEEDDVTYIVVEAPNGDVGVYCFHKEEEENTKTRKKVSILVIVLSTTTGLGIAASGYLMFDKYYLARRKLRHIPKIEV